MLISGVLFGLLVAQTTTLAHTPNLGDTFRQCLISYQPQNSLGRCLGVSAISSLQSIDTEPEFDIMDGVTLSRDASHQQEYRDNPYNYADQDPGNFRSIVDTFDHVFSKRAMRWDMGFIYPGLGMRVTPSVSPAGLLEFFIDPSQENVNLQRVKDLGTGRLLARQFLVPLLLGFKFNIGTLIPVIFGILVLLAKKIVFVSKAALIVSSALALGSLLFNNKGPQNHYDHYNPTGQQYYGAVQFHPGHGGHYKGYNEEFLPDNVLQYRARHGGDEFKLLEKLPETISDRSLPENQLQKSGRNFAWSELEKTKATS